MGLIHYIEDLNFSTLQGRESNSKFKLGNGRCKGVHRQFTANPADFISVDTCSFKIVFTDKRSFNLDNTKKLPICGMKFLDLCFL